MTWLEDRARHRAAVRVDPDGAIRGKVHQGEPGRPMGWLRRLLHVHVYSHTDDGPLAPGTRDPAPFTTSGPCESRLRCRCGDTIYQSGWVHLR